EPHERPTKMRKLDHAADPTVAQKRADGESASLQQDAPSPYLQEHPEPAKESWELQDGVNVDPGEPSDIVYVSKNQQKKLKRQQAWEAGLEARKVKRKEKAKAAKERRRERVQQAVLAGEDFSRKPKGKVVQLPITFIIDCDFDDLMEDPELKSLASQITRCYSDNRNARLRAHLAVSSFGGKLKERFDGVLAKNHESWKGIQFFPEDFVQVSEKATEWMKGERGGEVAGHLKRGDDSDDLEAGAGTGEVVYLSSESDVTLEHLSPHSTYIIGGLVDKNRYKGICYRRAMDRGIKTAKLPIGDFLQMNSRAVLATNHVLEIMLRWLELGDWGDAFMEVIPKRKGGTLRESA
ncbi:uncharacterized protein BDZ99DRAFT_356783, partial [Mytilinidion resinicola]